MSKSPPFFANLDLESSAFTPNPCGEHCLGCGKSLDGVGAHICAGSQPMPSVYDQMKTLMFGTYASTPPMPKKGDLMYSGGTLFVVDGVIQDSVSYTPIYTGAEPMIALMQDDFSWKFQARVKWEENGQTRSAGMMIDRHVLHMSKLQAEQMVDREINHMMHGCPLWVRKMDDAIHRWIMEALKPGGNKQFTDGWYPLATTAPGHETFMQPGEPEARMDTFDPGVVPADDDNPFADFQRAYDKGMSPYGMGGGYKAESQNLFAPYVYHSKMKGPAGPNMQQMPKNLGTPNPNPHLAGMAADLVFLDEAHYNTEKKADLFGLNYGKKPTALDDLVKSMDLAAYSALDAQMALSKWSVMFGDELVHIPAIGDPEQIVETGSFKKVPSPIAPKVRHHAQFLAKNPKRARKEKSRLGKRAKWL